jgi:hypothetical protein
VAKYLTGFRGVVIGSVIGVPTYTPTLVEVFLVKAMLGLGMDPAAALAFMIGGPMSSIPSMMSASRIAGGKVVGTYAALAVLLGIVAEESPRAGISLASFAMEADRRDPFAGVSPSDISLGKFDEVMIMFARILLLTISWASESDLRSAAFVPQRGASMWRFCRVGERRGFPLSRGRKGQACRTGGKPDRRGKECEDPRSVRHSLDVIVRTALEREFTCLWDRVTPSTGLDGPPLRRDAYRILEMLPLAHSRRRSGWNGGFSFSNVSLRLRSLRLVCTPTIRGAHRRNASPELERMTILHGTSAITPRCFREYPSGKNAVEEGGVDRPGDERFKHGERLKRRIPVWMSP